MTPMMLVDRPRGALEPLRPVRGCSATDRVHHDHLKKVLEARRWADANAMAPAIERAMADRLAELGTKTW